MTTILLVEDNAMNRDMLTRYLQLEGFEVLIARHGLEAIETAETTFPELIIMDLSLPVLDGLEATKRIKANERLRHVPILALTAHAMIEDRKRTLDAGCDEYETKPVSFPSLLVKLHRLLGATTH